MIWSSFETGRNYFAQGTMVKIRGVRSMWGFRAAEEVATSAGATYLAQSTAETEVPGGLITPQPSSKGKAVNGCPQRTRCAFSWRKLD